MNRFEELKNLVMDLEDDFSKFYDKDVQAAGTRVRKGMQDLKNIAQEIRKEVQDKKNSDS
jgi:xylose isomerase